MDFVSNKTIKNCKLFIGLSLMEDKKNNLIDLETVNHNNKKTFLLQIQKWFILYIKVKSLYHPTVVTILKFKQS
jgi:hypothetical protein